MARVIQGFKTFDEAERDERKLSQARSAAERIMLLHKLIYAWLKFPRPTTSSDEQIQSLKRIKGHAGNS
jgi:hypothetical protein